MAEIREAAAPEKRSYKKLHHIEIEPVKGENGGHIVTHHFHTDGMEYKKPEVHMFGKDEGSELVAHLSKHLKIAGKEEPEESKSVEVSGPKVRPEARAMDRYGKGAFNASGTDGAEDD